MGIIELHCALCFNGFNIPRIRTINEPPDAAWSLHSVREWVTPPDWEDSEKCSTAETGCCYVVRDAGGVHRGAEHVGRQWYDEILWFEHEGEFANAWLPSEGSQLPIINPGQPLEKSDARFGVKRVCLEHIAGPGCIANMGEYKGTHISLDEMRGCRTAQFLVAKEGDEMAALNLNWEPEADDMAFESESEYFLSGLCDDLPLYQFDATVSPARHGVWNIQSPGDPQLNFNKNETSLVFHSWCWGAWMQICKLRVGYVVVDRLVDWFDAGNLHDLESEKEGTDYEDDCNVELGSDYGYTVTNPFFVPRLLELIDKAANANSNSNTTPAPSEAPPALKRTTHKDPFTALPPEVRSMILTHLPSKAIHNLRFVSSSFEHLPNSLWKRILQEDMPWVWEVWSSDPPHFWATVSQQDIEKHRKEDSVPGHTIDVQARISNPPWAWKIPPHNTTDWHMLYEDIKRETREIRGLRNRRRIWRNLEVVVKGVMGNWYERMHENERGHPFYGP
ncbi:hypothetical protein BDW71DRAFT_132314 [Aspergillus fruticulosus]